MLPPAPRGRARLDDEVAFARQGAGRHVEQAAAVADESVSLDRATHMQGALRRILTEANAHTVVHGVHHHNGFVVLIPETEPGGRIPTVSKDHRRAFGAHEQIGVA